MALGKIDTRFVRKNHPGQKRVWYQAVEANLIMEMSLDGVQAISFEIDWDSGPRERACVAWSLKGGLKTGIVDTGENHSGPSPMSQVVSWDERIVADRIAGARKLIEKSDVLKVHADPVLAVLTT